MNALIKPPIVSQSDLASDTLDEQVVIVTGAGGGIGFEAARALAWLGAHVVIAEIDRKMGRDAAERINREFGRPVCTFIHTDVGDEGSVKRLAAQIFRDLGKVDAVVNNATVAPVGAVTDTPIAEWDLSYRVNLRGPALMARAFLPGMLERNSGAFICVSSVGEKYMGAYESLKAAQVHLARTLDAELEGTNVIAFTIGPGLILTETAQRQIALLAPLYGQTVEAFYEMGKDHIIPVEAAGAGFAAAVALAPRFRGMEIDSRAALIAAGIDAEAPQTAKKLSDGEKSRALDFCKEVRSALEDQARGWDERSIFERQWMKRDFQKFAGLPVDQVVEKLRNLENALCRPANGPLPGADLPPKLAEYFAHYLEMAVGYLKDPAVRLEQERIIGGWKISAESLAGILQKN
jgi:NAD(P)-dependent dehydrogenase (short-subunit alcohol dehydrogenase family)